MNRLEASIAAGALPLWLEADAYAARLLAPEAPPWRDSAAYIAWQCKTVALLEPGIAAVKLAPIAAWIGHETAMTRFWAATGSRAPGRAPGLNGPSFVRTHR